MFERTILSLTFFPVSIGRRLLDPLAEFVKYDPKHLGVGQYQVRLGEIEYKIYIPVTALLCIKIAKAGHFQRKEHPGSSFKHSLYHDDLSLPD